MFYKYYTCGEETSREGVTLATAAYDDNGKFIGGIENTETSLYHVREVTKEVYDNYAKRMLDPEQRGMYGVVNEKGRAAYLAWMAENHTPVKRSSREFSASFSSQQERLITSFFSKLVEANIISESDKVDLATILGCSDQVIAILTDSDSNSQGQTR